MTNRINVSHKAATNCLTLKSMHPPPKRAHYIIRIQIKDLSNKIPLTELFCFADSRLWSNELQNKFIAVLRFVWLFVVRRRVTFSRRCRTTNTNYEKNSTDNWYSNYVWCKSIWISSHEPTIVSCIQFCRFILLKPIQSS